jgi:S-adenosylmethionine:tRNA ribosyltransferase-isomerase
VNAFAPAPALVPPAVLRAATAPRPFASERLLVVDVTRRALASHAFGALPSVLAPGDLVVVNDAATLPAALPLTSHAAELRLAAWAAPDEGEFWAVAFGSGSWRLPTEERGRAPLLPPGEGFACGALRGTVVAVDADDPALVRVRFELTGAELWRELYRAGHVVSYSYLTRESELWDVNNHFAARPWAFEAPSAGLPLTFELLGALRRRGVEVTRLTHAAGLSSTGSAALDRRLPLPERYDIPSETVRSIEAARRQGGRVLAVGTTVVRALESSAHEHGTLRAGAGEARLVLGPAHRLRVVDGLLTGLHAPGSSHFRLLAAFAPVRLLEQALAQAAREGYLAHEFGDACLILRQARERAGAAPDRLVA